ncbi:hypothetical protein QYM36_001782, partial [Artemia franciscana]
FFSVVSLTYCCSLEVESGHIFNLPFGMIFRWFAIFCIYSIFLVILYLLSDLSRLSLYLEVDWGSANCLVFTSLSGCFILISTLIICFTIYKMDGYYWLPEQAKHEFLVTA